MSYVAMILWLDYSEPIIIPYRSAHLCGAAIMPMKAALAPQYPNADITCLPVAIPLMRPVARPVR